MRIEKRLQMLSLENPNYSLLWAQWEFDKKLLTRSLNVISRDFPHYSLHDASHSSTIINQIEKVISRDIEKLSATDCWLILESCYWHDSGMIINDDEKKELLKSQDFKDFLLEEKTSSNEISKLISELETQSKNEDLSEMHEKSRALNFIIADYYRRKHAQRSGEYVLNPHNAKINSPRTSLIPSRLFGFVAEIVSCHGKSRTEILKIAKSNDGMDSDDYAHPRYVASLLRIGDLLDIDDGRFCPTMLSNIGTVPPSSLVHQKKHASVKHISIDSSVIEIKAICHDYESYEAQSAWFDYIREEFSYQSENWNKISPDSSYRNLPIIGELDCSLEGYLDIDGKTPKIQLYNKRVYEYLSSSLLYGDKHPYIREVIQNAIDAHHVKVWDIVNENDEIVGKSESEVRDVFNDRLERERIFVTVLEQSRSDTCIKYKVVIKDSAIGMSFDDIKKCYSQDLLLLKKRKKKEIKCLTGLSLQVTSV